MKRSVFLAPQILFIASCAGAVFAYVYTNLDAIMEVRLTDVYAYLTQHHLFYRSSIFSSRILKHIFIFYFTYQGQRQNLERTVTEQKSGLKSVQEKQAAELKRVQNEQAANIERARQSARDAQNRR